MNIRDKFPYLVMALGIVIGIACIAYSLLSLPGCKTEGSVCENIPEGQTSFICKATDAINVSPENLSKMLLITNLAALEANHYTAQEAMTFIEAAEDKLNAAKGLNTLTYGDVVNYLLSTYGGLSPAAQAVFTIVDPLSSLISMDSHFPDLLSDFDIDLLLAHLLKQKTIIKLYL